MFHQKAKAKTKSKMVFQQIMFQQMSFRKSLTVLQVGQLFPSN
jgi:hypothetical protein